MIRPPQIACLMIVGPGEGDRYLDRVLTAAEGWADLVLVYGDGPDPTTRQTIASHDCIAAVGDENLRDQGEHLVRNHLFELADRHLDPGDIAVVLDADEIIHGTPAEIRSTLLAKIPGPEQAWNVHFLHLWTPDGTLHRVDGMWQPAVGTRIYRHTPGYRVETLGAWVCPPVPRHLMFGAREPILTILHWGYANPADRPRKHDLYTRLAGHHPRHIQSIIENPTLEPVPA